MSKKTIIVLVSLVCILTALALSFYVAVVYDDEWRRFQRIETGMSLGQVETILDGPATGPRKTGLKDPSLHVWMFQNGEIWVTFGPEKAVTQKELRRENNTRQRIFRVLHRISARFS